MILINKISFLHSFLLMLSRTYKPWTGNCLLNLQSLTLSTREMQDYLWGLIIWVYPPFCFAVFQDDNFIHRYRPINIRCILFGCYLHFFMAFLFCVCVCVLFLKDRIYLWFIWFTNGDRGKRNFVSFLKAYIWIC